MDPTELLYAESHEWVHVAEENGQKLATVGVSQFAIEQLKDLVYIDLPEVGAKLSEGMEFGEVESVKAVSPLYCPVSGEVTEVNGNLADDLDTLNKDPFGAGWMIKVRLQDEASLSKLMDHTAYVKQCGEAG